MFLAGLFNLDTAIELTAEAWEQGAEFRTTADKDDPHYVDALSELIHQSDRIEYLTNYILDYNRGVTYVRCSVCYYEKPQSQLGCALPCV